MGLRLHEASKKFNITNKEMAALLAELGYEGKTNPLSGLPDDCVEMLENIF